MTDHPSALVSVPDAMTVCVAIAPYLGATDANDWTGLEDDDAISMPVKMRVGDLRALKAVISAPAAPQAAVVGEIDEVARWHEDRAAFLTSKAADDDWAETEAQLHRDMAASLRAPSREPEGGGVPDDVRRLVIAARNVAFDSPTQSELRALDIASEAFASRVPWDDEPDALATREEAPAEAGEIGAEYDAAAHCVTLAECPPGLFLWNGTLGFKSEYGAMEPVGISPHHQQWKVGNRADAYCADSGEYFWGGTSNHDDRAKLLVYPIAAETVAMVASHGPAALLAQPQAREDAQPVARAHVRLEDDGLFADLEVLNGEHLQVEHSPVDLFLRPAPDALQVAVEALEKISALCPSTCETSPAHDMAFTADQALAALQAEQGAK